MTEERPDYLADGDPEEWVDAGDALRVMGLDPDEAVERDRFHARRKARTPSVCVCGHPVSAHRSVEGSGHTVCRPSRTYCPCEEPQPVIQVSDLRPFVRKTAGPGHDHALSRGIAGLIDSAAARGEKATVRWLVDPRCSLCGSESGVVPVPFVVESGKPRIVERPSPRSTLACPDCLATRF